MSFVTVNWKTAKRKHKKNCAEEKSIALRSTGKEIQVASLNKVNFYFTQ